MTAISNVRAFAGVFRFVWNYWTERKLPFLAVFAGLMISVVLEVQVPARSADLVTAVRGWLAAGDGAATGAPWDATVNAAVLLLLTFAAVSVAQQLYVRIYIHLSADVMRQMGMEGFARVQRFGTSWHANNFAGATVRKITRGMWAYDGFADMVIVNLGPAMILLVAFTVDMSLRDTTLGLYFAASVIVFLLVSVASSLLYVAPANEVSNDADTAVGANLADAITCNAVIKGFGAEDREDERMDRTTRTWRNSARRAWRRSMDAGAVQSLLLVGLLGGLLLIAVGRGGTATHADDIVYVVTAYFVVNGYLRNVGWQVRELQRGVNELEDLVKIAQTPPHIADAPDAVPFVPGPGAVQFDGVTFRYGKQTKPVFDGLTVSIEPGEKIALVGPSGAGKTTFVKLVQRLYDANGGRILVDGQDVGKVKQSSLRRAFAIVPQDPVLFHRTLAENIAYGAPGADQAAIERAAQQAHAHDFIARLPDGYETLVGERGIKLSGGERQRVAIARAILADAPFLILDEATSSLDSETELMIQKAVEEVMKGRTSIMIAHRLSTIRKADRILVFDGGRIVEQGSHEALIARPQGAYRRLHDVQALGFMDPDLPDPSAGPVVAAS